MTTPTQAQIEAAAEKIWEDFSARLGGEWKHLRDNAVIKVQCMATAKAALTAAAQVGVPTIERWRFLDVAEIWGKFKEQIDDRDKATIVATIERCAQVAENFYHEGAIPFGLKSDIAAAIRKLKD